jgi:predicted nucleotidyltransferase
MPTSPAPHPDVTHDLDRFVEAARSAFAADLVSVVLFGSAAEGRLRPASDVNVILILKRFDPTAADGLRAAFRTAHAAIHLEVMFLLEREVPGAIEAFAVKFADILTRRRVLHGPDRFAGLTVSSDAIRTRLDQVLLNLILRLRERYTLISLREEQLAPLVADLAGPLRAAAAALRVIEGQTPLAPRESLESFVAGAELPEGAETLRLVSRSREDGSLPPGQGRRVVVGLMDVAERLRERLHARPAPAGGPR